MEPCTLRSPRHRARLVAAMLMVGVLAWDTSALAVNAIVSQDLPILTSLLATELDSYVRLGAMLEQIRQMVAAAKEYSSVAKTAWGALDELRHLSADEVLAATKQGLAHAFPQVGAIYGDVQDIRDLSYRDHRAYATLSGILWDEVYGPGIEYLSNSQDNIAHVADWEDHRNRHRAKTDVFRRNAQRWQDDCSRTAKDGEGACRAAANRAAIQTSEMVADLHETALNVQHATQKNIEREDRHELDEVYAWERWTFDLNEYLQGLAGNNSTCRAGECLYRRYGDVMRQKVALYRQRHLDRTRAHLSAIRANVAAATPGDEEADAARRGSGLTPRL